MFIASAIQTVNIRVRRVRLFDQSAIGGQGHAPEGGRAPYVAQPATRNRVEAVPTVSSYTLIADAGYADLAFFNACMMAGILV